MREMPVKRTDATLGNPLAQELVHLFVLPRFGDGGWGKASLIAAGTTPVFGMAGGAAIAPNVLAATGSTELLCEKHSSTPRFRPPPEFLLSEILTSMGQLPINSVTKVSETLS
ncbi:hypothetical protein IC235_15070 [Hymenobacter sp. BT664]|uniref:Uncharacterized protein n=1 Tax=Hymenobacter montanus TaxID=2771359 RepID=A0A927GK60_9BACT|nr:hypothetical protein [Hymenobacter montanus]MBD2769212.1 hypothetical protein [Hymenobacter montanus]